MSITRATRKQLLAHLETASAKAGHHPPTTRSLLKAFADMPRSKIRELIYCLNDYPTATQITEAAGIIARAEADLGHLSDGQRRDLLKDNTKWPSELCDAIVEHFKTVREKL